MLLGEPSHVVLTDLPVGAWSVAMAFDALDLAYDRPELARAWEASIGIGGRVACNKDIV